MANNDSLVNAKLQKSVKKLIAEEFFAYQIYTMSILAVKHEDAGAITELFNALGHDEMSDHMAGLVEWCRLYNVDIPCEINDFKRIAEPALVKLTQKIKSGLDACSLIDLAVKSEEIAIKSYKDTIDAGISEFTDLQALIWHIYYDEQEHLEKLHSAKIACEVSADLIM